LKQISKEVLKNFYLIMTRIRLFEEKVNELFLKGEIPGFVHLYIGEEAIATGVCQNLRNSDYITSTHRGHGHTIAKGAQLKPMMAEIFGKRTGYCKGKGGSMHIADFSVGMLGANGVVGGGYTLAAGAALACKMQGRDDVAVCFFGDGASNRGTFHEAVNMAAAWKLPVVFVCENNQWASTTPYRTTTAVENIADRSVGYGIPGEIVDGNDVFDVYEKAARAVERARTGGGPTLLEAKTYRIKGHFVGDPELYRSREEVQRMMKENDPITRLKERVIAEKRLSEKELAQIEAQVEAEIREAEQFAVESPFPEPHELYEDLYVEGGVSNA
jgi:pyruvate dehydrogenase E1 component alpha subunit